MKDMNKEIIARYLNHFIKEHKLTQEEFARMINAPLSSVSSWVHGKRQMSKVWQHMLQTKKVLPEEDEETFDLRS